MTLVRTLGSAALAAALTLTAPCSVAESSPTIAQFLRVRAPGSPTIAPDGTVYLRDWPDGVNQLYKRAPGAPIDAPLRRLTDFADGLSGYTLSHDGTRIVLSAAVGGSEQNNLYLFDTATEQITTLFEDSDVVYTFQLWLPDSSGFAYTANDENPRNFHVYIYDFESGKSRKILAQPGTWNVNGVSNDGTRFLTSLFLSVSDTRAFELDTATWNLMPIVPQPEGQTAFVSPVGYLPGEGNILISSDFEDGTRRLYVYTPKEDMRGVAKRALSGLDDYELDGASVNLERTLLGTTHNEGGYSALRLFRLPAFTPVTLPKIERGVIWGGGVRDGRMIWTLNNAQTPGLAFAWDVPAEGAASAAPRQITARMDDEPIDLSRFRLPELVTYTSFDGLEIPAFLYLPDNYAPGKPVPFVINYHGGPEGQSRPTFNATVQYLVANGYGVMLPNVRGSTGYGRDFHMMDNYTKRWDSVKDGVEAARWLVQKGYTKKGKIAAYGGSYGGFMACATIIEGGDLYGASVNVVGIVNFVTFLEQTRGYRQALREAEYGPLTDRPFLESISPIKRIDEIRVPMLIAHGLNDPRVPVGEAMQLATELQKRGHDPELLFFHDEGHGFAKLENRALFNERMVRFLDEHIGD